jgi:hypothetical protein
MAWLLLALALAAEPSDATIVYYNARMALSEGEPLEAAKLWLLRNTLADHTGQVSPYDGDFTSVTWAALGEMGVCQDGLANDDEGAGLWPLAMHNWVVSQMGRRTRASRPRPFDAFAVGRQQRFVSIGDVLSASEMKELSLFRGRCLRPKLALTLAGESPKADLSDRMVAARLLLSLVDKAEETLRDRQVRGRSALAARRFDLYLQLAALSAREARQEARAEARRGRQRGLSRESAQAMLEEAPDYAFGPTSPAAEVLRDAVTWAPDAWMALSAERRRFLFIHARAYGGDPAALDAVALGVIDALIAAGDGAELQQWIGLRTVDPDAAARAVWADERGQRILAMDDASGFDERAVIALHRAVHQLEGGDLSSSLRSFAYALQRAPGSTASDDVARLSRRWLSYVAGRFALTDELLRTLRELVPAPDYAVILEDLLWRAALHADPEAFARGLANQPSRGAIERRLTLLTPLARGDVGAFQRGLRAGMAASPAETTRFIGLLLQRLELEEPDVRAAHHPTLVQVEALLETVDDDGRQARVVAGLLDRSRALRDGIDGGGDQDGPRAFSPDAEIFMGSVRLAPADPLPWPFRAADVPAPSVFEPFELLPEAWRDADGDRVLGWGIRG